jgi:hypothetical protein
MRLLARADGAPNSFGAVFSNAILSISLRVFSVFVGWKNLLFARNFSGQL